MLDGDAVRSCLMYAVQADRHRVTTVEGLAQPDGSMSVLQDSFCEMHGLQCGYCTPGMLIAAQALLNVNSSPTEEEIRDAIGGNLCRCTGDQQIVEAVQLAASRLKLVLFGISVKDEKPKSILASLAGGDASSPTYLFPARST